jgi:nucleoid-associated protein YgaU
MGILDRLLARNNTSANPDRSASPPVPWRTYLVTQGDNLWKIAKREYGDSNWWYEIFNANRRLIKSPDLVHPGMTLRLP